MNREQINDFRKAQQIADALSQRLTPFYDAPRDEVSDDDVLAGLGACVVETWVCLIGDHPLLRASVAGWLKTVQEQVEATLTRYAQLRQETARGSDRGYGSM